MAAKQTRRSVSLSRAVYDSLKSYSVRHNRTMSKIVELSLRPLLMTTTEEEETPDMTLDVEAEVSAAKDIETSFSVPVKVPIGLPEKGRPLPSMPSKKRPPGNISSF